jgi:hypothetical protein
MTPFKNKYQMIKASDDEIREFFATTIFEGVFSKEIKSSHAEFFKGHIHSIKITGESTNVIGNYINVPISANDIPEGECTFKCRLKEEVRLSPSQINFAISPKTLRCKNAPVSVSIKNEGEVSNEDLFELWGVDDCECIGYYHYDAKKEMYYVDDLRKTNFDHIPPYLSDIYKRPIRMSFPFELQGLELDNYYRFTWKLSHKNKNNPHEIHLDLRRKPKTITPKWFINKLFEDRHSDKSKNFGSAANFLDTLSKQLSAKESTFVYELLQNANDYPVEGQMVDVEFHITDNYLLFLHSGDKFNVRNISGICGINEKEKVANKKTIGYKGIGFKTVFLNNHYVYIRTGDYSFRFDQGETPEKKLGGKIKRQDAPFQILPIWTDHNEVAPEVNSVFDDANPKFQVQIALRPDSRSILHVGRKSYENLFREVFSDSNIILFIPNINSVRVFINGTEERTCYRNNEEWIVNDYEQDIEPDLQELVNKTIEKGNSRIPEKYRDFECTRVSFACKHKGALIEPVDRSILYCYLPTSASWGFPFLMNTDMIPKGDRNDIEKEVTLVGDDERNFNQELAAIAGVKLFFWIKDLLTSKKYQLGSVFSLIPDFRKCIKEHDTYEDYIKKFGASFDECIEKGRIVPVRQGIANVKRVILDTTGLTTSSILTDEEFFEFSGMEDYYLPLPILRKDKHFNSFLKKYADNEQKFTEDNLPDLIANSDFQEWLSVQENNDKFLNFLLENGFLNNLLEEEIFLGADGYLYCASDLFYDIDKYLVDLRAFENHVLYLSPKTREFFKDNGKWNDTIDGKFAEFDCDDFVNNELFSRSNKSSTIETLKDGDASIHFFKFLAENVTYNEDFMSFPFIADDGSVIDDFEDKLVFFSSDNGHKICSSDWMSSIHAVFVSDNYEKVTKDYLECNFGVRIFTDEIVVKDIILSDDYHDSITNSINENFAKSKDFVLFCYNQKEHIEYGGLRKFSLHTFDGKGKDAWCLSEDHIYFQSDLYDEFAAKEWVDEDWMYALDGGYLEGNPSPSDLKAFIKEAFWVNELTPKNFYTDIVKHHLKSKFFKAISGTNDIDGHKNLDFIRYLDANYKLVFEEEKDDDSFSGLVIVTDDVCDINVDASNLYIYDEELKRIVDEEWFPEDLVSLCHPDYGKSKALSALGVKTYKFGEFYDDVVANCIEDINSDISTKEQSIAFHNFIIEHIGDLTSKQLEKMRDASVFLYGQDGASDTSSGHKILSSTAKELFDMGLVEFSDLDIIDPDYKNEENLEYWETRLGNTKYTVSHFFAWLKDNKDTFRDTLQDEELNIKFWRWMKKNSLESHLSEMPVFPVLLKDHSIDNSTDAVYFSDEYMDGAGIEHLVHDYDKQALFISPDYIDEGDNVADWKKFWTHIGVKFEIVDILVETVIPKLANIENEHLPRLLAENRESLEKQFEEHGLVPQLTELRVKGHDGEFYAINEAIYIDCEKEEPFPYIKLPNQISYSSAEERRLIKDVIDEVEGDCVETLSEWQQCKLDCYLTMQNEDEDSVRPFHYQFVNSLSIIRNNDRDSLKEIEGIENILLLNKDEEFCDASSLTMGSVYHPFFDFEKCGIESLNYVSDSYNTECSEYVGKLFRSLKIHCDFTADDVDFLEERECSIYFWQTYLTKKDTYIGRIKDIIEDHLLDELDCIPTKDYMKKPCELYYGSEVSRYVKAIEDWDNKIPLTSLPDIKLPDDSALFSKLPFKESLDFLDALYALITVLGQDRRTQLLYWMIDSYEESYKDKIQEYRNDEHALWKNNKNEDVQIKDLYALDYGDKTLEQYFGTNPRIVNKAYFPVGDSFKEACDILGIVTITSDDLKMEPVGDSIYTARDITHKLYALIIAGMTDAENWKDLYGSYCECLDKIVLHRCKSIMITYTEDEDINQSLKKFYHKQGENDFYFVDSLDGKRVFKSFVEEYIKFLGIDTDEIAEDVIEDIMDSKENALEIVKEQNSLMLDEEFKNELDRLIPGIKRELFGNDVTEEDEDYSGYRPSFTTSEPKEEDDDDEIYEEPDSKGSSSDESNEIVDSDELDASNTHSDGTRSRVGNYGQSHPADGNSTGLSSPLPQQTDDKELRKPRSDKGSNHDYPTIREPRERKVSTNTTPTKAGEGTRNYSDMNGWEGSRGTYTPQTPKPFSPEDVRNFGSRGVTRTLEILEPTISEVAEINRILGEDLSAEQVADLNYLAQLRLYNNLVKRGMTPSESKDDFVRNAHMKNEHTINGGKYIHKCSAAGGIMYLSPAIWNKIADDRCVVCVYLGAKSNEFMYFNSIDDILEWIGEDDIVIKLTGEEKADVVEKLYSSVLDGVKGTAYTLIRINSNEKYNSLFAQLPTNNDINETEENLDEYAD